jgi:hypothetical protein
MLEEADGKVAGKRMQVYGWHKHGHASVSADPYYRHSQARNA